MHLSDKPYIDAFSLVGNPALPVIYFFTGLVVLASLAFMGFLGFLIYGLFSEDDE